MKLLKIKLQDYIIQIIYKLYVSNNKAPLFKALKYTRGFSNTQR